MLRGYLRKEPFLKSFGPFSERRFSRDKGFRGDKKTGVAFARDLANRSSPSDSGKVIVFQMLKESLSLRRLLRAQNLTGEDNF